MSFSSSLPLPQRWTTWKSFNSSGRILRTALLTATAPRLPPTIRITGLTSLKPQKARAFSLSPVKSSWRIGDPVRTALSWGRELKVSGKLQHTFAAEGMESLLASPGVISDSWMITGTWFFFPAITTGTLTNPPFEKITSGFNCLIRRLASLKPFRTRNGSVKFWRLKYRRSLPEEIPWYGIPCCSTSCFSIPL